MYSAITSAITFEKLYEYSSNDKDELNNFVFKILRVVMAVESAWYGKF